MLGPKLVQSFSCNAAGLHVGRDPDGAGRDRRALSDLNINCSKLFATNFPKIIGWHQILINRDESGASLHDKRVTI